MTDDGVMGFGAGYGHVEFSIAELHVQHRQLNGRMEQMERRIQFLEQQLVVASAQPQKSSDPNLYQKVLTTIDKAGEDGMTPEALRDTCDEFRNLGNKARSDLIQAMEDDGAIVVKALVMSGTRARTMRRVGTVYVAERWS